ncbi:MAG: secretion protein HlyD [Bacilli bacterium]|nr:secretion protein HlyD [Bacilli bacterium]
MVRLIVTNVVVFLLLLGVAGGVYYYSNDATAYITTDDAQISGQLVPITPQIPGPLTKWSLQTGDQVTAGQNLGEQDNTYAAIQYRAVHGADKAVPPEVLSEGVLQSPINGTVLQTAPVGVGQSVAPGQTLAVVSDTSHLSVVANVQETDLQDVKVGNAADIYVDAMPGTKFTGTVARIGSITAGMLSLLPAMNASGNYTKIVQRIPVSISFGSDAPANLKPGMNATVKIHR